MTRRKLTAKERAEIQRGDRSIIFSHGNARSYAAQEIQVIGRGHGTAVWIGTEHRCSACVRGAVALRKLRDALSQALGPKADPRQEDLFR